MFRTILTKTLHEKRWMTLGWSIATAAMALLMMGFYHSFSEGGFDEALQSLPDSFKAIVGDLASLKTVPGYVSQQIFELRIPLLTIIMGIILFNGLLAGDESDGTLQSLLSRPVSRTRVYLEKLLAGLTISFIICLAAFFGVLIGMVLINEQMSLIRLLQSVIGVWFITILFGSLAYCIGAISGQKGLAGSATGIVAFSFFLLTSFAPNVSSIDTIEKLSPFHYYNQPSIAEFGLHGGNSLVLVITTLTMLIIGWTVFRSRDISK